jgi:hypothetical protein
MLFMLSAHGESRGRIESLLAARIYATQPIF